MTNAKLPTWFWIISILALLWNLMGVGAFVMDIMMTPETLAKSYTAEQVEFLKTYPSWTKIFYGLATVSGFIGCVGLLLRKKWALGLFVLSLIGVIIQQGHAIFLTDSRDVFGDTPAIYFPLMILVISVFLILFTSRSIKKGYLV